MCGEVWRGVQGYDVWCGVVWCGMCGMMYGVAWYGVFVV
jgi:hypothetical protein